MAEYACGLLNAANDTVKVTALGNVVSIQAVGTWSATLAFEASNDASNWAAALATPWSSTTGAVSATSNCGWLVNTGANLVRVRASAFTSGTVGIFMTAQD